MDKYVYILAALFLFSCEKEINLDLSDDNPKANVFSGAMCNDTELNGIRIHKTTSFSVHEEPEKVLNAAVKIINNGVETPLSLVGNSYVPPVGYQLQEGSASLVANIDGVEHRMNSSIAPPLVVDQILYSEFNGFDFYLTLDAEDYYFFFELEIDSSGTGNNFQKDVFNFGDAIEEIKADDAEGSWAFTSFWPDVYTNPGSPILYRASVHRISREQYQYLHIFQDEQSGNLNLATPGNLPFLFSNQGLGIALLSSAGSEEFSL